MIISTATPTTPLSASSAATSTELTSTTFPAATSTDLISTTLSAAATSTDLTSTTSPTPSFYSLDQCYYIVDTSGTQKAIYGIMATSLIINFGIFIWWLTLDRYKRKRQHTDGRTTQQAREIELQRSRDSASRVKSVDASRYSAPARRAASPPRAVGCAELGAPEYRPYQRGEDSNTSGINRVRESRT